MRVHLKGENIRTIIQELKLAKSNRKKEIINTEMTATLKEVFTAALSPLYNYQMTTAPSSILKNRPRRPLLDVLLDLEIVRDRTITGNACRSYIQELHDSLEDDDRFVFRCVIEKDLRCGVQATLVNNALGYELISTSRVSLCTAYSEKAFSKFVPPYIAQEKLDGARCYFIVQGGAVSAISRNGRPFTGLETLSDEISMLYKNDCVVDSELTVIQHSSVLDRKTGNGILNKSIRGTITSAEAADIYATVFDCVPLADWKRNKSNRGYIRRWTDLKAHVLAQKPTRILLPETAYVNSAEEARKVYTQTLKAGKEGIIIKSLESGWEGKRLTSMMKMKVQNEVDLEIMSVQEGTGKNIGILGAFACSSADRKLFVSVGSGYSDEERLCWYTHDMIGRIITVAANDYITRQENNVLSLYLPTFVELREDKDVADSTSKVVAGFDEIYGRTS